MQSYLSNALYQVWSHQSLIGQVPSYSTQESKSNLHLSHCCHLSFFHLHPYEVLFNILLNVGQRFGFFLPSKLHLLSRFLLKSLICSSVVVKMKNAERAANIALAGLISILQFKHI